MAKKIDFVLQLKVTLRGIRPPIWRRIVVPNTFTFLDLHHAIQDAMPWTNSHLFEFEARMKGDRRGGGVRIGTPDVWAVDIGEVVLVDKTLVANFFAIPGVKITYRYDFGDDWEHDVKLEKVLPAEKGVEYPICTGGKRACPPENCGGIWGYADMQEALADPEHPEHKDMKEWFGDEDFDPEAFDPSEVVFLGAEGRFTPGFDEFNPMTGGDRESVDDEESDDEDSGEDGNPTFRIVRE